MDSGLCYTMPHVTEIDWNLTSHKVPLKAFNAKYCGGLFVKEHIFKEHI